MGMSGEQNPIAGTPFSKRMTQIEDIAYDLKKQAAVGGGSVDTQSLLVLIVNRWKEDRIRELIQLTVGKESLSDVTQSEIDKMVRGQL